VLERVLGAYALEVKKKKLQQTRPNSENTMEAFRSSHTHHKKNTTAAVALKVGSHFKHARGTEVVYMNDLETHAWTWAFCSWRRAKWMTRAAPAPARGDDVDGNGAAPRRARAARRRQPAPPVPARRRDDRGE